MHQVDLRVPYEVEVGVLYRCGTKRQQTKISPVINGSNSVADFKGEKLTLLSSLARDKDTGQLQERNVSSSLDILTHSVIGTHHRGIEER